MPETVYQLARSLGVSAIDVIRQMTIWGAPARSATSPVPPTWQTPWLVRYFDRAEIDAWMAAGLDRNQHATAETLRQYGVTPGILATPLTGRTAAARLRGGEPVGQVIARLREAGGLSA